MTFYNKHAQEQAELVGELSAAWSKLEGYAARLALVIHCIRQVVKDGVNSRHVDEQSMAAGIALAEWFGHEAKRVYSMLAESQEDRHARELAAWIEQRGGKVTVRDLTHGLRRYRANAEQAESDLESLAAAKLGRWETPRQNPKGGRQPRVFHLVKPDIETASPGTVAVVTDTDTCDQNGAIAGNGDGDDGDVLINNDPCNGATFDDEYDQMEREALQLEGM
jgi:hypothetical protein